jgi:hypothetical protein
MTTRLAHRTCRRCGHDIPVERHEVRDGSWRVKPCPVCEYPKPVTLLTPADLVASHGDDDREPSDAA